MLIMETAANWRLFPCACRLSSASFYGGGLVRNAVWFGTRPYKIRFIVGNGSKPFRVLRFATGPRRGDPCGRPPNASETVGFRATARVAPTIGSAGNSNSELAAEGCAGTKPRSCRIGKEAMGKAVRYQISYRQHKAGGIHKGGAALAPPICAFFGSFLGEQKGTAPAA